MKGCLRVVRGSEIKLALPGPSITEKADGTLWMSGNPLLGITDAAEKTRCANLVRAGKADQVPAEYFVRLGDNPNGLWAGTDEAWDKHPAKLAQDQAAEEKRAQAAKQVRIYLSARGWGDYSPAEWIGDITRPDAEIMEECKKRLAVDDDIDQPNQTDAEILAKITQVREAWTEAPARKAAFEAAEKADIKRKIETGYCFACESYCAGDCGHYSKNPLTKFRRDFAQANREANYGIND